MKCQSPVKNKCHWQRTFINWIIFGTLKGKVPLSASSPLGPPLLMYMLFSTTAQAKSVHRSQLMKIRCWLSSRVIFRNDARRIYGCDTPHPGARSRWISLTDCSRRSRHDRGMASISRHARNYPLQHYRVSYTQVIRLKEMRPSWGYDILCCHESLRKIEHESPARPALVISKSTIVHEKKKTRPLYKRRQA